MCFFILSASTVSLAYYDSPQLMRVGSRGESVLNLQKDLESLGFATGPLDGIFGNQTRNAVLRFQTRNRLLIDGIVGRQTKGVLRNALNDIETITYTVRPGDTLFFLAHRHGTTISAIQNANNLSGHMIFVNQRIQIPKSEPQPEPKPQPQPEPQPEPKPQPKPQPEPQPQPQPEPKPLPQPQPEPQPQPQPEPQPQPQPQPQPEPKPEPQPEPKPEPQPEPKPEPKPSTRQQQMEQEMLNLINHERTSRGLTPLVMDHDIVRVARLKSQDMIDNRYFAHQSPVYGSPFDMMRRFGISFRTAGENLAGANSVNRAHTNLMNSPGHRANILNPSFTHIGIGIVEGGPYGIMFTQMFVGR